MKLLPRGQSRGRSRASVHCAAVFVGWPVFTVLASTLELMRVPYYSPTVLQALMGSIAGSLLLLPEFIAIGAMLTACSVWLFGRIDERADRVPVTARRLLLEPVLLFAALWGAATFWFPALLSHAILIPLWWLPAWLAWTLWMAAIVYLVRVVATGQRAFVTVTLVTLCVTVPGATVGIGSATPLRGHRADMVLLGLDSVGQTDDVTTLRNLTEAHAGHWYQYAVAPALLTNAVWASILTGEPVREHGVFHTFQSLSGTRAPLIVAAQEAGFTTVSVFPDQLTCSVGSEGGFDVDHSGPLGWRQLVLPVVANSSVLLPLIKPLVPRVDWLAAPPNHAGTFSYDVGREIRDILMSGQSGRPTLTAAHITYLHHAAYPRLVDLSWDEFVSVAHARSKTLRDRSFDWQDVDEPTDPLALHQWKRRRLQDALATTMSRTRFVEQGGRLVLFSDHGDRAGLTQDNFLESRFHHVVLASFGVPAADTTEAISLIEIGALLGLKPQTRVPPPPAVEFVVTPEDLWPTLISTAHVRWSGLVELNPLLLAPVFNQMRVHRPWVPDRDGSPLQPAVDPPGCLECRQDSERQ